MSRHGGSVVEIGYIQQVGLYEIQRAGIREASVEVEWQATVLSTATGPITVVASQRILNATVAVGHVSGLGVPQQRCSHAR